MTDSPAVVPRSSDDFRAIGSFLKRRTQSTKGVLRGPSALRFREATYTHVVGGQAVASHPQAARCFVKPHNPQRLANRYAQGVIARLFPGRGSDRSPDNLVAC